ncbi:diguanylate cyclase [Anaeromyxobacter dehalogenans 2CP-1]|uniref:diguanylate cyclase n=1 Tax=Anaeromyxobacter dehalogenans (strain ATCC BAA-258 / DSM 21875 / 2CP-1) TaxID=455488 RepID=B8J8R1_ANAD2|nr:GGDEF domain-containing protein [Anaeromyxobacter dehalogenans]ACL63509.1 diguanylate cyclase [Anaeromyxobacter dehalogenans 2CP-1]
MGDDPTRVRTPEERAAAAAGHCLVFVAGDGALGLRVPLDGEVVLGRDPSCAVALPASDVSRRHARVVPDGDGHLVLDLGSTNGTWVNGREVAVHRLAPGDRVQVGAFVARYLRAGDAEESELAALADLALRDPLTGLPNRRAFEESLRREVARARRGGDRLAVAVLDVDRFKDVNDRHGHAAGDVALAEVARRASAALRAGDLLARIGGEELAAILPGADVAAAAEVAERVRRAVGTEPVQAGGQAIRVTVSLGCAELAPDDADGADLFARADGHLYRAKHAGRDRVEF